VTAGLVYFVSDAQWLKKNKKSLMPMTHLPETRASNPALETRKCDMLSSAGF